MQQYQSGYAREYRTTFEANKCIKWIKSRRKNNPWFASLAFSNPHTPTMPAPLNLVYDKTRASQASAQVCDGSIRETQAVYATMVEALDRELGRLLVEAGIATENPDGSINYDPFASNTMVIVTSDNGSFGPTVKAPFDPSLSKGFVYQTGLWVPLIISGPLVVKPGRQVDAMVSTMDLFALFGEIAEVNYRKAVPKVRAIDAMPLMPYLVNPEQGPIRTSNFIYWAAHGRTPSFVNQACVIESLDTCIISFFSKSLCEDNDGTWYGEGGAGTPEGFESCCALNEWKISQGEKPYLVLSDSQTAIRNEIFKYITFKYNDWNTSTQSCEDVVVEQFYRINENVPIPRIDRPELDLLNGTLSVVEQTNLDSLKHELEAIMTSATPCPGKRKERRRRMVRSRKRRRKAPTVVHLQRLLLFVIGRTSDIGLPA